MSAPLAVTRKGEGMPLVLVHGYFGGAGHWSDQITHFSERYDVIAVNLAGFGESAHVTAPDSIEGHATLIWQTLDGLGVDTIFLLGHSMGGMIVQQMTAMQPARVDGTEATMRRIAATWLVEGEAASGYAACLTEGMKGTQQAALASLTAWEKWDGRPALPEINAPTLVVWGERDKSYPRSQPDALLAGIPDNRFALMPGCAHAAHLEKPALFHQHLDEFLAR